MENKKMYITLAAVVLSCISLAPLIVVGEVEYGSECSISNVAPLIAESHFSLSSTTAYIGGSMGEPVEFSVDVSDANGAADVSSVMLVLSDDENIKNILVAAKDSANLPADNNGVKVGTIELNPVIGFEVKNGTGGALTTLGFSTAPPGMPNLSSNQNPIQIKNIGGVVINVSIHGTDMTNGNETLPISNMKVDGIPMSTSPQLIAVGVEPSTSSTHNITVNYPIGIPPGAYQGTVIIEITA
ncbi:MAG: hypothetical protein WAV32_07870 [Halobacteriota archaeon]